MSGRLVAREGARTWVVQLGTEALVLGRAEVAAVRATFAGTSQQHCRLELVQGSWWAVDLNSTNGTFVNDGARLRRGASSSATATGCAAAPRGRWRCASS